MSGTSSGGISDPCCIYGLEFDGHKYLVNGLFTSAKRIPLAVGQSAKSILEEMEPDVRWFVWHVFLTYKSNIPQDRAALSLGLQERGIRTINEKVTDGSKRHTQAILSQLGLPTTIAAPEGDPDELLFFKSNYNFGGLAERRLTKELRDFFGIALPHQTTPLFKDYQLAERRRLSTKAFEIEDLFIERYVDNRSDVFYRAFVVFDAVVLSRLVCKGIIKKALEADQRDDYFLSFSDAEAGFPSAPDDTSRRIMGDLHSFCKAFGLEVGGLDILIDNQGVPHIIDANPTSYGGANCDQPGFMEHLTQGLLDAAITGRG